MSLSFTRPDMLNLLALEYKLFFFFFFFLVLNFYVAVCLKGYLWGNILMNQD